MHCNISVYFTAPKKISPVLARVSCNGHRLLDSEKSSAPLYISPCHWRETQLLKILRIPYIIICMYNFYKDLDFGCLI